MPDDLAGGWGAGGGTEHTRGLILTSWALRGVPSWIEWVWWGAWRWASQQVMWRPGGGRHSG